MWRIVKQSYAGRKLKMDRRRRNVDIDRNADNVMVALQSLVKCCNVRVFLLM